MSGAAHIHGTIWVSFKDLVGNVGKLNDVIDEKNEKIKKYYPEKSGDELLKMKSKPTDAKRFTIIFDKIKNEELGIKNRENDLVQELKEDDPTEDMSSEKDSTEDISSENESMEDKFNESYAVASPITVSALGVMEDVPLRMELKYLGYGKVFYILLSWPYQH